MKEEYTRWDEFKGKIENLPGCVTIFIFVLVTLLLFSFVHALWYNCGEIDKDELLIEEVRLDDGNSIYIVHSWRCPDKCLDKETRKPKMQWFEKIEKSIDFVKYKFYVYDFCIDEIHAKALDAISNANIADFDLEYLMNPNDMKGYPETLIKYDTSSRDYYIYYSIGDSLTRLPKGEQSVSFYKSKNK